MLVYCTTKPNFYVHIKSVLNPEPMWFGNATWCHTWWRKHEERRPEQRPHEGWHTRDWEQSPTGSYSCVPLPTLLSSSVRNIWLPFADSFCSFYHARSIVKQEESCLKLESPWICLTWQTNTQCVSYVPESAGLRPFPALALKPFKISVFVRSPFVELHDSVWVRPSGWQKAAAASVCATAKPPLAPSIPTQEMGAKHCIAQSYQKHSWTWCTQRFVSGFPNSIYNKNHSLKHFWVFLQVKAIELKQRHTKMNTSFSKLTLFLRSARDPPSNKTRVLWEWLFWQAKWRGVLPALEKYRKI